MQSSHGWFCFISLILSLQVCAGSDLVGHWTFNEGTGTVANDSSGNGNHGTLEGGATWTAGGAVAGSILLDGSGSVIVPHSASFNLSNGWTLAGWIYRSTTGAQHGILEKYDGDLGAGIFTMRIEGDDKLVGHIINNSGTHTVVRSNSTVPANQWVHTAIVYSGTAQRLTAYINGVEDAFVVAPASAQPSTSVLRIGARGDDATHRFNGKLDDLRIYNGALSPVEIQSLLSSVPIAVPDNFTVLTNQVLNVSAPGVLGNDTDANGSALQAVLNADASSGVLVLNANGSFTYTPANDFSGTDTFTYNVTDVDGNSNVVTVALRVTNGPPKVSAITPALGGTLTSAPSSISVTFSENIDASTLIAQNFTLIAKGPDGTFDTADDISISPSQITPGAASATLTFGAPLADGDYRLTVKGTGGGSALQFDGVNDFVSALQWLSGSGNAGTVECWMNATHLGRGNIILHKASWNDMHLGWRKVAAGDNPTINLFFPLDHGDEYASAQLSLNVWYHLAGVYDGNTVRLYIDGVEKMSVPWNGSIDWSGSYTNSYIGGMDDPWGGNFPGLLDEIRIWSIARTPSQIQEFMRKPLSVPQTGLRAYYRFEEGSGQIAADISGNNRTATLGGSSAVTSADPSWVASTAPLFGGIRDTSGEALDGEFTGTLPSGDNNEGGDFVVQFTVNAASPVVSATSPENAAADVPCGTTMQISFSEPMNTASVEAALAFSPDFQKSFAWTGSVLTITPNARLEQNTLYSVSLDTGATDAGGTELAAPYDFSFTTDFITLNAINPAKAYVGGMSEFTVTGDGFKEIGTSVPGTLFNGHNYLFVNQLMTWPAAKAHCESLGGHLVTITSAEENAFVTGLTGGQITWIGITDSDSEGQWTTWITGEPVTYTNWGAGEPNDSGGAEDGGEHRGTSGTWNDGHLTANPRAFVCEFEVISSPTVALRQNMTQIFANSVEYVSATELRVRANLASAPLGAWDVQVTNPNNGAQTTLAGALQVQAQPFQEVSGSLLALAASELAWGDFDNDGDLDLIQAGNETGNNSGMRVQLLRNDGGSFTVLPATGMTPLEQGGLTVGDFDRDGKLDVIQSGWTGGSPHSGVLRGLGDGTFASIFNPPGLKQGDARWLDFDNDGDLDFIISGENSPFGGPSYSLLYRNNGNNNFTQVAAFQGIRTSEMEVVDYDNDGDFDILQAGSTGGGFNTTLLKNESGVFTAVSTPLPAVEWPSIAWGDYDNDGDFDLAFSGYTGSTGVSSIYRNDGGTLVQVASINGIYLGDIKWADVDNDGDLDLAAAGRTSDSNRVVKIYFNSNGVFTDSGITLPGFDFGELAFADYDKDGLLDLALTGDTGAGYLGRLYRNVGGFTPNTSPSAPSGLGNLIHGQKVRFNWSAATDTETPATGLTYNLRVGTAPGKDDVLSAAADASGWRKIVRDGNVQKRTAWTLTLPLGTYYWSVQTIDTGFAGSAWAPEQIVVVDGTLQPTLSLTPENLSLAVNEGQNTTATIELKNTGIGTVTWNISDDANWLDVSPQSGTTTTETEALTVSINTTGLVPRTTPYTATITVSSPDAFNGPTIIIPVSLTIRGLYAWWKLDDGSGNSAVDSTGNGNTGTLSGPVWTPGILNGALSFDGPDDRLNIPGGLLMNPVQTVSLWFKTSSGGPLLAYQSAVYPSTPASYVPILYVGTDGKLRGQFWNGSVNNMVSASTVNDDQWHLATLVANTNTQSLYLDGVLVSTLAGNIIHLDMTNHQFGLSYTNTWPATSGGWRGFVGGMDDLRFYNYALSPQEVLALLPPFAPVAASDSYVATPDQALAVSTPGVLQNDTDRNGNTLTAIKVSDPSHGTVLLNSNGSFTYTPENGYRGSDSFTYRANDGGLDSAATTVYLQIGPITSGLAAHWKLDELSGDIASDSSGNNNHGTLFNSPGWHPVNGIIEGALKFNGVNRVDVPASVSLEPNSITVSAWAFITSDSGSTCDLVAKQAPSGNGYVLRRNNGNGRMQWRILRQNQQENAPSIIVTDTQANSTYLNGWHCFTGSFDAATGVSKFYVDGVLRASSTGAPGTLEHSGNLTLMGTGVSGLLDDTRIYGRALSDAEVLALANRPPNAVADAYTFAVNTPLNVVAPGVLANDTDAENDARIAELVTPPALGTVNLNPNGSFVFTPPNNYAGLPLSFTYRVKDFLDRYSQVATVTLNGPAPTLTSVTPNSGLRGATVNLTLAGNNLPTYTGTATPLPTVRLDGVDDYFSVPSSALINSFGTDLIAIRLTNGTHSAFSSGDVQSTINQLQCSVNTTPLPRGAYNVELLLNGVVTSTLSNAFTVIDIADLTPVANSGTLNLNEDTPTNGTLSATDPNGDALTFSIAQAPQKGVLTLNSPAGLYTYVPSANVSGLDSFTFQASDGVYTSNVATISVTINPLDDAPEAVLTADSSTRVSIGELVTLNGAASSDVEGNIQTYRWDFGDGAVITTLDAQIVHAWTAAGVYTVTLTVTDSTNLQDSASITILVSMQGAGGAAGIPDSDGDGFSDEMEVAMKTDPLSALSTPMDNKPLGKIEDLDVAKLGVALNLASANKDSITMSGTLPIPDQFSPAQRQVAVNIGGVLQIFTLDEKGATSSKHNRFKLQLKQKKGIIAAQTAKYTLSLKSGSFADELNTELAVGQMQKNTRRSALVSIIIIDKYFEKMVPLTVTGSTKSLKAR